LVPAIRQLEQTGLIETSYPSGKKVNYSIPWAEGKTPIENDTQPLSKTIGLSETLPLSKTKLTPIENETTPLIMTESTKESTKNILTPKSKKESILGKLHASPHWTFIDRLSQWFFSLPQTTNPTPSELLSAQEKVELVLRLDMKDAPGCEERLERLLQWGTQDEPNERWSGWKAQLKSLAQLRDKKSGVMKWEKVETAMKSLNGTPRINGTPTPRDRRKEMSDYLDRKEALAKQKKEAAP
jgi:hypothetical protein